MKLVVVPIHLAGYDHLLPGLLRRLEEFFGLTTRLERASFDPELAREPARGQYNSRVLMLELLREPAGAGERILGVSGVDLFVPVLTFVFGEAQLDGRAAVVSIHRLQSELYGLPADAGLLSERLLKEAIHELGHTFGLIHCASASCVMHSSTYVEEIDLKPARFCDRCQSRWQGKLAGAASQQP